MSHSFFVYGSLWCISDRHLRKLAADNSSILYGFHLNR